MARCCAWMSTLLILFLAAEPNASHAAGGGACKPVNGRIVSQAVPIGEPLSDGSSCVAPPGLFCTSGKFTGGLRGTFDFTPATVDMSGNPDFPLTGIAFFTGELILHKNHGALVFKWDGGSGDGAVVRNELTKPK